MIGRITAIWIVLALVMVIPSYSHAQANNVYANGIADMGIYPNGTSYGYTTESIMGIASVYNISTNVSAISFSLAGNFLVNMSGNMMDFLYIDSAIYNESNGTVCFADYIFDDSYMNASIMRPEPPLFPMIMGNGNEPDWKYYNYNTGYIYVGNTFNLTLKIQEVYQQYHAYMMFEYGINGVIRDYDNPRFTVPVNGPGYFVVNGSMLNPVGLPYDIEFVVGNANPLNASLISMENGTVLMNLEYYNGYNFQSIENAVNYGGILPDVLVNSSVSEYSSNNGMLFGMMQPGSGNTGYIYSIDNIGIINATMPSLSGIYEINGTDYPVPFYNNGYLILAIAPGNYSIVVKEHLFGSVLIGQMGFETLGNVSINVSAGSYYNILIGNEYQVIFNYIHAPKKLISTEITNLLNGKKTMIPPFEPANEENFTEYTFLSNSTYEFTVTYGTSKVTGIFTVLGSIVEVTVNLQKGSYTVQNIQ
ncbi:MAG: thermopsin family protease [Thermoplasmata archaeon]